MRCSLSGWVEALVVGGQPWRLLPFVNPCSVRIDGTDSWLLLRLRRLRNAAITTQAVMHEDAAPASAAHEMGMKLLDLHIVQLVIRSTGTGLSITALVILFRLASPSITVPVALFRSARSSQRGWAAPPWKLSAPATMTDLA